MRESGSEYDRLTQKNVRQLIIGLSIPTTVTMLVSSLYNMIDTMFVSQLGTSASGAVGIVFGFMSILQACSFMLGQGAGNIISRLLGNKDIQSANKIASTSFFLTSCFGVLIAAVGLFFITPLTYFLGATKTIYPFAKIYLTFILFSTPFTMCAYVMNNILRFEGKASVGMIGIVSGALLNILGDFLFMFVCGLGIAGAGLSTALSQVASFCILLWLFSSHASQIELSYKHVVYEWKDIANIVGTGFPSLIRQGLESLSTVLLNDVAGPYGDAAIAAMNIVSRISMVIFSIGLGLGQGYQPVCGYNYGAQKYDRVKKSFRFTFKASLLCIGVMALVGLAWAPQIITLFRDDPAVVSMGVPALRYQCLTMFLQPAIVLANMTFQSVGYKRTASFLSMLRNGLYFIPALFIGAFALGMVGVQLAQPIADILSFVTSLPFILRFIRAL